MSILEDIKHSYRTGGLLTRLIFINVSIYLLLNLALLFLFLFRINVNGDELIRWLAVPSDPSLLLTKPWTVITYMFTHEGFFHILFNMMMLFFGGRIFTEYLGESRLLPFYLTGGLAGALLFIICYNVFPAFNDSVFSAHAIGASASVLAIFIAIATYLPDYVVHLVLFGAVRLKVIAVILVAIDLLSINRGNPGGHIAHLGGALFGFIAVKQLQKGNDFTRPLNKLFQKFSSLFKPKSPLKVKYKDSSKKAKFTDEDFNLKKAAKQKKVDEILDKISRSGYESLTKEEKELLFKISNDKD